MSGTRIGDLPAATLPLSGTEEVPLRAGPNTARLLLSDLWWGARGVPIAQQADSGIPGGNARGARAVDLQTERAAAAQVASGANSNIGGGSSNSATGAHSSVLGGSTNTASAQFAAVIGGTSNTASATGALAGGGGNTASGIYATALGANGTANGVYSWIPGGQFGWARGHVARGAWGSPAFGAAGAAQAGEFVLATLTTGAAAARLTGDGGAPGATNTANLPNNGTYRLKLIVSAQQTAGSAGTAGDCASWEAEVLIKRGANAAATVFVGGRTVTNAPALANVTAGTGFAPGLRDAATAAWTLTLAADTTNGGLAITGTGEANKTIRWVARLLSVEVTA